MISIVRNVMSCITSTLPVVTQSMIKPTPNGNRFVSTILCGLHRPPMIGIGNHVLSTDRSCSPALLQSIVPRWTQVAGFKVKGRLKKRCKDCYFVMRQQRLYVICKTHPRHKQMSMKPKDYKSWILTHATQSKVRPY